LPYSYTEQGFSLLEVLVALAVLSISLGALSQSYQVAIHNSEHLRDKTLAQWVALNELSRLRLQQQNPPLGKTQGKSPMGHKTWYWQTEVFATDFAIRRITIQVYPEKARQYAIVVLDGFL
jgi:general secretion pathway protein I